MPRFGTTGVDDDDGRLDDAVATALSQLASMSLTVFGRSALTGHRATPQQVTGQLVPAVVPSATP